MTLFLERTGRSFLLASFLILLISFSCKEDDPVVEPIVDDTDFRNPILTAGPDPWVFRKESTYYVTHTTGNSLKIYKTEDMSKLSQAASKTVWTAPATGMNSRNIWAPELHYINNKWYFYYAADDGNNANHRMWVLENTSADPFQGTWTDKGELELLMISGQSMVLFFCKVINCILYGQAGKATQTCGRIFISQNFLTHGLQQVNV